MAEITETCFSHVKEVQRQTALGWYGGGSLCHHWPLAPSFLFRRLQRWLLLPHGLIWLLELQPHHLLSKLATEGGSRKGTLPLPKSIYLSARTISFSSLSQSSTHIHLSSHWPEHSHTAHTTRKSILLAHHWAYCHSKYIRIYDTIREMDAGCQYPLLPFSLLRPGGQVMVSLLSVASHHSKPCLAGFHPPKVPEFLPSLRVGFSVFSVWPFLVGVSRVSD